MTRPTGKRQHDRVPWRHQAVPRRHGRGRERRYRHAAAQDDRAGRLVGLGQDDAAAHDQPHGRPHRRARAHRRHGCRDARARGAAARHRLRHAELGAPAASEGDRQRRHRAAAARNGQAGGARARARAARHRGPRSRPRGQVPEPALRRAAAARRRRAGTRRGPEHPVDGRAVRCRRPDRASGAAAGAAAPAEGARQDGRLRHPRHRRGVPARRPGRDPAAGRPDLASRVAHGDPRESRRRLRRGLRGRQPRQASPAPHRGRRPAPRRRRRRPAGGGPRPVNWLWSNLDRVGELMLVHLALSVPAIILSFVVSVPIGWLAHRYRWSRGVLLSLCALLYAVPSLALFIALPAITGLSLRSPLNLVIALTLYGIAVIVRTATDAFDAVERDVLQSATAMGYSVVGRFWGVELPLAGPVLLSGLRVVIVSTVSLATVGAVIGVPSLGSLFTDGFQRGIQIEIITGIIATIVLALVLDWLSVVSGRMLMPWSSADARSARSPSTM